MYTDISTSEVKIYVCVKNLLGAYYFDWVSVSEFHRLVDARYEVQPSRVSPRRASATQASCEDIIADISYMLCQSQYGVNDESSEYARVQSDAAVYSMRDVLELMLESLGQDIQKPPSEFTQNILDQFTKTSVKRMQKASIMLEKKAGASS